MAAGEAFRGGPAPGLQRIASYLPSATPFGSTLFQRCDDAILFLCTAYPNPSLLNLLSCREIIQSQSPESVICLPIAPERLHELVQRLVLLGLGDVEVVD